MLFFVNQKKRVYLLLFQNFDEVVLVIRKLAPGKYRLYSRKKNPKTNKRRNLGTFKTRRAALKHEKDIQFFKRYR